MGKRLSLKRLCEKRVFTFLGEPIPLLTAGAGVEAALGKLANEGPRLVDSLTSADRGAMSEAESDAGKDKCRS